MVVTQFIERRERSRFIIPKKFMFGNSARSISTPPTKSSRISVLPTYESVGSADENVQSKPEVHVSTKSIVLKMEKRPNDSSSIPIQQLRRMPSVDSAHRNYKTEEDVPHVEYIVKQKIDAQPITNEMLNAMVTRHRLKEAEKKELYNSETSTDASGQFSTSEFRTKTSGDLTRRTLYKRPFVAFFGVKPFNIGSEYEIISIDNDFSNLDYDRVSIIIVGRQNLRYDQLKRFEQLQMVIVLCPTHPLSPFPTKKFITEEITPRNWVTDTADSAMIMILDLFRRVFGPNDKRWKNEKKSVAGKSLGIIGLGRVGIAVLERAKNFQFQIFFYDPMIQNGIDQSLGVQQVFTPEEIFRKCDCITLHCSLNDKSKNLINGSAIRYFKRGSLLVNVSSPLLVDSEALFRGLKDEQVGAAALGYYEPILDGQWNCIMAERNEEYIADDEQQRRANSAIAKFSKYV